MTRPSLLKTSLWTRWAATVTVDRTTIEATTAIRTSSGGGGIIVRVGASKLAATTNVTIALGAATVTCVATYDEDYATLARC